MLAGWLHQIGGRTRDSIAVVAGNTHVVMFYTDDRGAVHGSSFIPPTWELVTAE